MYRQSVGIKLNVYPSLFALRSVKPAFIFRKSTERSASLRWIIKYSEAEGIAGFSVAVVQVPRQRS